MSDLGTIEAKAKEYADAREELGEAVRETDEEVQRVKRRRLPVIRRRVDRASNARAELEAAIRERPDLFKSPKTMTLFGIRLGYQKGKGKVVVEDAQRVVKLIRKHFPDRFEDLVKVEEKPVKSALNNLTTAELKKIGCTVTEAGEDVFIKPTDSEIDKFVDRLLEEAADQDGDQASGQAA
jgi:hypothetical protein